MEQNELLELVREYEQRISKLEQQVLVLEKAINDVGGLGVPHYGIHCKRVLEEVQGILGEALRNSENIKCKAQVPSEGKS